MAPTKVRKGRSIMHILHGPAGIGRDSSARTEVDGAILMVALMVGAGLLLSIVLAIATGGWLGGAEHLGWI